MTETATLTLPMAELTQKVPVSLVCLIAELLSEKGICTVLGTQRDGNVEQTKVFERDNFFRFIQSDTFTKASVFTMTVEGHQAPSICREWESLFNNGDDALPLRAGLFRYDPCTVLKNPSCFRFCDVTDVGSSPRPMLFWSREIQQTVMKGDAEAKTFTWFEPGCVGRDWVRAIKEGRVKVYTHRPDVWEELQTVLDKPGAGIAVAEVVVINSMGIHVRPCGLFTKIASRFNCEVTVEVGDKMSDGKGIMGLMNLEILCGSKVRISAEGPDAVQAVEELVALVERKFDIPDEQ